MSEEQYDARPDVGRVRVQPTEEELQYLQRLREQNQSIPLALAGKDQEIIIDYHESSKVEERVGQSEMNHIHKSPEPLVSETGPVVEQPVRKSETLPNVDVAVASQPVKMGDLDTAELDDAAASVEPPKIDMPEVKNVSDDENSAPTTPRKFLKANVHRVTPAIPYRNERSELVGETLLFSVPGLSSFNVPPDVAEAEFNSLLEGSRYDPIEQRWVYVSAEQEAAAETIAIAVNGHAPKYSSGVVAQTRALAREDAAWDQSIALPDGGTLPLVRSHANQDNSARGRIRRAKGSGVPVTLFMPKSGFLVTYRTPHEREFCDMDLRMASETGILGVSTYGLLMSASSGIYMKHMLESTMQFVTETSLNLEGRDMSTAILANLDMQDAALFVLGPIIAKYPGGLPWQIICASSSCGDVEEILLNLARCIRAGNGLFSSEQLDYIVRTRGKLVTLDEVSKYRSYAKVPASHVYTKTLPNGLTVSVEWKHTTALNFFEHADSWIETNNKITNAAMMEHVDEGSREAHLRIVADQRRLVRNMHFIGAIVVTDVDGTTIREEERGPITEILEDLSEDKHYVLSFEEALANYIEDSRLSIFGYMAQKCRACGNDPDPIKEGPYRGLVPLSPDRLFFTLSRVVSAIQNQLATQFASIG